MELREYGGPDDLRKGCYGIMEPTGNTFTNLETIDVAVIPGMSFDSNGNRLGRGKGYYDRFLKKIPNMFTNRYMFRFPKSRQYSHRTL
jgi:5-formyltetrahydrofolate cyclo-ligase